MVIAAYFLKTIESNTEKVLEVIRSIETPLQFYRGCRKATSWQNPEDHEMLMVSETWETQADLENYIKSPLYRRMLEVFEMCSEKPEIQFVECNLCQGIELIEHILMPLVSQKTAQIPG